MGIYVRQSVWPKSSLKFSLQKRTVEKAVAAVHLQGGDLQKTQGLVEAKICLYSTSAAISDSVGQL